MSNKVTTKVAELTIDGDGIIHMTFFKNVKVNLEEAKNILIARKEFPMEDGMQRMLVDMRNTPQPEREAREYAKAEEVINVTRGMALLVDGPMSKLLGNFFLGFNKGGFPTKLFTDTKEAKTWLLQL